MRCYCRGSGILSYKKIAIIVFIVILAVVGLLVYLRDNVLNSHHDLSEITDVSAAYQAEDEIAEAKRRLQTGVDPAEVITTLPAGGNCVAIVIDGLPDRPLAARLVDVLQKHHAEATFFVEGQNAADQPETIRLLRDQGFELGNYTLVGLANMEQMPQDVQLQELCQTQKILSVRSSFTPTLFRAPRTKYTDELLRAVQAADIPYAVKENVRFNRSAVSDEAAADAYVSSIADGSIISVQVGRPAARRANAEGDIDERPAIDMKPTIHDETTASKKPEEDLATQLDRLLTAFEKRGVHVINVNGFRKIRYIPSNAAAVAGPLGSMVQVNVGQVPDGTKGDAGDGQ